MTSVDDARSRGGWGNCDRQSVLRMEWKRLLPCPATLLLQWPGIFALRKGLDVNIASAMASEASDKTAILNCLILPRAGTKALQQEAPAAHESNLIELWSSLSDFPLTP